MTHPERYDDSLPEKSRSRHLAEVAFQRHAQVYTLVNIFLIAIWAITSGLGSPFWPIWSILPWGLALGLQGAATYGGRRD